MHHLFTANNELTIDVARDWFKDRGAQACLFEEIARDHGFQLSDVERAHFYFNAPSPFTPDYRAAVRDALIAQVRADRAKYDAREKAHQQARRAELKAKKRAPPTPSARVQPYRAAAAAASSARSAAG